MPNQSKNHQENRQSICFLCMQKAERTLTAFLIQKVHELVKSDLDFNDLCVPTGICHTCRKLLKMRSDGNFSRPLPSLYAFETIQIKPQTRLSSTCDCLICKIGKARPYQEQPLSEPKKRGHPATEKNLQINTTTSLLLVVSCQKQRNLTMLCIPACWKSQGQH